MNRRQVRENQVRENGTILDWNLYLAKARETVAEGCVLLRNERNVLPLQAGTTVSVFGRIQSHYYKSGVGSGGMVNVDTVVGILEGLENSGKIALNGELLEEYVRWEREHPYDEGCGWGREPWSQEEMPLTDEIVERASEKSSAALVIIGRTAGEDRDAGDIPGSYRLTEVEEDMLARVRKYFDKVAVILNVGGIIDMSFVDRYLPEAVLYVWQGGMVGGDGVADILTGAVSPSGKLTDTIAYRLEDYPSTANFGDRQRNFYCEDIYVGYRYFETFARDRVRYPFGYGMSYTEFEVAAFACAFDRSLCRVHLSVVVTNTGKTAGKEVVQVYVEAPQGKLGRPARELAAFAKTERIEPGQTQELTFDIACADFAAYDDSGATGHRFCRVLEAGEYVLYVGTDVRSARREFAFSLPETIVTERLSQAYAPTLPFCRIRPAMRHVNSAEAEAQDIFYVQTEEHVPVAPDDAAERAEKQPVDGLTASEGQPIDDMAELDARMTVKREISGGTDKDCLQLADVLRGDATMEAFISQMTDYDLSCIVSGEGMGSPLVTPGTASAMGGVSEALRAMGIPAVCCSDGPSGIRMDCGTKAFSLPNGTLLGCTFNVGLVEALYGFTGMELAANRIECLLGPGMNIHRHPLNGRNFEYFSEDPLVTGAFASAVLKGLKRWNVSGVMKHFCGNNQELGRRTADAVISERALRDIYLKGFEIAVKSGYADAVMTSYGVVNGIRTSECYDLCTRILREEWGFNGIVMTDWWANISSEPEICPKNGFRLMVRSQNDVFMVNTDAACNDYNEISCSFLATDNVYRMWLRRSAANICRFVMRSRAMERLLGTAREIEIVNRREEENQDDIRNLEYIVLDGELSYDLSYKESKAGTNYVLPLDTTRQGTYEAILTGYSTAKELAQIPCTLFATGTPVGTFTFNGTNGEPVSLKRKIILYRRKSLHRLYVAANGVSLTNLTLRFISDDMSMGL